MSIAIYCPAIRIASKRFGPLKSCIPPIPIEAIGIASAGTAASRLANGGFDIGGRVAVCPSGGLLAMGHPIGPTGVGQICELTIQLRGEAGDRQHPGARTGLAHMVGVGAVCVVHVLRKD